MNQRCHDSRGETLSQTVNSRRVFGNKIAGVLRELEGFPNRHGPVFKKHLSRGAFGYQHFHTQSEGILGGTSARIEYGWGSAIAQDLSSEHNIAGVRRSNPVVGPAGKLLTDRLRHALLDAIGIRAVDESGHGDSLSVPHIALPGSQAVAAARNDDHQQREDQYPETHVLLG